MVICITKNLSAIGYTSGLHQVFLGSVLVGALTGGSADFTNNLIFGGN